MFLVFNFTPINACDLDETFPVARQQIQFPMEFSRRIHPSIFMGHKLESAIDKKKLNITMIEELRQILKDVIKRRSYLCKGTPWSVQVVLQNPCNLWKFFHGKNNI